MPRLEIAASRATAVSIDGREFLYFGGCGYLGLAHHPRVVAALSEGARRYGVSSGAARETSGNALPHEALEADLARTLECGATILLPEGYTANLAAAQALGSDHQVALIDERSHPSLFDAAAVARLETRAVAHSDVYAMRAALAACSGQRAVVMTDSVFPSRGEIAPLRELQLLAGEFDATLLVDDCHGTGVIGARGRGALEHGGLRGARLLLTSTLSKAFGCYGGFVAGDAGWIERVRARSRVYIGTTPIPPALAEAGRVALELAFGSGELVGRMRANVAVLRAGLAHLGLGASGEDLPVFAFALDSAERMERVHLGLRDDGILAPYVRYPGGPPQGNFRLVVSAAHTLDDIERLVEALARRLAEPR